MSPLKLGVLALQGDFQAHIKALARLDQHAAAPRKPEAIAELDGLVMPGGESTTLLKLMDYDPDWRSALTRFHREGRAILATCAGLILCAREVTDPPQESFAFFDAVVARNGYGRQLESFECQGAWEEDGSPLEMVFIRAPRITEIGPYATVLARRGDEPVLIAQGRALGAAFHPELTDDLALHARFVGLARESSRERTSEA